MKQKRNWHFKLILFFLSFALAFPVGSSSVLAADKITHTPPEGNYVPGFRIQLDVEIEGGADLLATRCYFKTRQDQNFAFVDLVGQGDGNYKAVLPAPWLNSEAVEYLFVTVDKDKQVTRTPLFMLEEGETQEAAAWQDASQVKEVRIDTMQEAIEDCEVVRRQLRNNHRSKLPRYQIAEDTDPLMVQTELDKNLVPLNGFYDAAVVTEVADSAKYGFMADGIYNTQAVATTGSAEGTATAVAAESTGWSTATIVGVGLGVAAVAGGTAIALNDNDDDNDNDGGGGGEEPEALTATTILGRWDFEGERRDGVRRTGTINFAEGGTHTYTVRDADGQSDGSGTGTWSLTGTSMTVTFESMSTWVGSVSGDSKAFILDTTSGSNHGIYDFTR